MSQKRIIFFTMLGFGLAMMILGVYLAIEPLPLSDADKQSSLFSKQTTGRAVTVPSRTMWSDTGIDVASGTTLRINYQSGRWTYQRGGIYADGQGVQTNRRDLLLSSSNLACLVGKVGNTSFHIGNSYNGTPGSGRLYLAMNDIPGTYDDNDGQLVVNVSAK